MEAAPPSYSEATVTRPLQLVAPYISSGDLCAAALVSKAWHTMFAPQLWGNPAAHFGIENDAVYIALTKFRWTLRTARLHVRSLTHTLHMPPAHAELYNGPHADWLRDVLAMLPNLQSLVVRGLPFFDYSALEALKRQQTRPLDNNPVQVNAVELPASRGAVFTLPSGSVPSFALRLLDASRCSNATSGGLAQALSRFESLLYVDLSYTYAARDPAVLRAFRSVSGLQVLKLCGISLTDEALQLLATSIGRKVRSLDVRRNAISDRGVRTLLQKCFISNNEGSHEHPARTRSPSLLPYIGSKMLRIYQSEYFESFLRNTLTRHFVDRQAFEDAPEGGITHLYVAKNKITVEGAASLLRSGRLHVLDLEKVSATLDTPLSSSGYDDGHASIVLPGVEKLTPVIARCATNTLTFVRINHSLVTKCTSKIPATQCSESGIELEDSTTTPAPPYATELDSTTVHTQAVELPAVQSPRYELSRDPMASVVTSDAHQAGHVASGARRSSFFAPEVVSIEHMSGPRRASVCAPEVVDSFTTETEQSAVLNPGSSMSVSSVEGATPMLSPLLPVTTSASASPLRSAATLRPPTYSSAAKERRATPRNLATGSSALHPAMLPHMRELFLTNVPPYTHDGQLVDRLICFIKQCAEESWRAKQQALVDYALPPGRSHHASTQRRAAESIFALRRIVLELDVDNSVRIDSNASSWQHANNKSMTDDRDSETLWAAAENDFSFFGEEDYNCSRPEPGKFTQSQPAGNGTSAQRHVMRQHQPSPIATAPRVDTVALLSAFRKDRKAAHQRHLHTSSGEPETEGYWDGIVSVVRPGSGLESDEDVDYYGNLSKKGYLYP